MASCDDLWSGLWVQILGQVALCQGTAVACCAGRVTQEPAELNRMRVGCLAVSVLVKSWLLLAAVTLAQQQQQRWPVEPDARVCLERDYAARGQRSWVLDCAGADLLVRLLQRL